ncbi:MAG: glycosyltransferase [Planctomycetales bacterium]|nr:glycosyltransferase [Planctomycetales bacterium]
MKVALVHDWLTGMRGGERCLESLARLYPDATIFTLLHVPGSVSPEIERHEIRTSYLQKIPGIARWYRRFLPLFPSAIESLDLRGHDLVISVSHCVAKGVVPPPDAAHFCYCLTPMRYVWDMYADYFGPGKAGLLTRAAAALAAPRLRAWDVSSCARVDRFAAISRHVAGRIRRFYGIEAEVLHPPVDCSRFRVGTGPGEFYLVVSALVPYKRVDLAVAACTRLGLPLRVIGEGPEERKLRAAAGPTVEFLGRKGDPEVAEHYERCRAFLFPGEEDFGITPLEAHACGRPVVAYGRGGILDTVVPDGKPGGEPEPGAASPTGLHFAPQTQEALEDAIRRIEDGRARFDSRALRARAESFDKPVFERKLRQFCADGEALAASRRG